MGLIIAAGDTKPAFPYDFYYGVKIKTTVAATKLERVGRPELHVLLPVQSKMRRCVLRDNGTVAYYLHATDSAKRDNEAAADLTGADGQVMVEIPKHYRKFEFDGTELLALISEFPLPGFHEVPLMYRSAYEATVDRTTDATPKLASVVNTAAAFRGGNNTAGWDNTCRTLLGRPATDISLTSFRNYARNRGTAGKNGKGWNCDLYAAQLSTYWLFVIEYANLNCQAAFNAQPDAKGCKQGGLGNGVTALDTTKWNTFNSMNPFVPCGATNSLGNATGCVKFTMPDEYDAAPVSVQVPSYRGIENPFGHIWSWTDGCKCEIQGEADGGLSKFYVCNDPAQFQDSSYNGYEYRGGLPRTEGNVKAILAGEYGENMPLSVGGSSTTFFCDYFYTLIPASGVVMRGVLFGGRADWGADAGLASANTDIAASDKYADVGSRLCFIPEAA